MEKKNKIKENGKKNNNGEKKSQFKSKLIESLIKKYQKVNSKEDKEEKPKDAKAINLSDILIHAESLSDEEIANVISDINKHNITISVNKNAIKMLNDEGINQEKIQKILSGLASKINIDISSIADL